MVLLTPFETDKLSDDNSIGATRTRTMIMYMEGVPFIARLCMMNRTKNRTIISRHHSPLSESDDPGGGEGGGSDR